MTGKVQIDKNLNRIIFNALIIFILTFSISIPSALAAPITIINPGFETDIVVDNGFNSSTPTGWIGVAAGTYNPTTTQFISEAPEGQNTVAINLGSIRQDLSTVVTIGQTYTLKVEVGRRLESHVNFPGYNVELLAGGNTVGSENILSPN